MLHLGQPAAGRGAAAVVEQRHDLALEQLEEAVGLGLVAPLVVLEHLGRGDGPAVLAVEALVPPAVEDRAVERAVEGGLHARGAARLLRAAGVVQPHVGALVEGAGDGDVVVLEEHEPVADAEVGGEADDLLDHRLAVLVGGVGLAGEHELHRPVGVERAAPSAARAATAAGWPACRWRTGGRSTMVSALGSSTSSHHARSDGEKPRAAERLPQAAADERDQALAADGPGPPQLVVAGVEDAGPPIGAGLVPLGQHVAREHVGDLRRTPTWRRARRW